MNIYILIFRKSTTREKITYYLQKCRGMTFQREGSEENVFENRSQDETEGKREIIKDKGK